MNVYAVPIAGVTKPKGEEAPHTGTTIVACLYPGGVVLGADGRVSTGNYVSNRASNKIASLADTVYLLRSGSAPDAQIVSDHVSHYVAMMESETQTKASVSMVANLVREINYKNKDSLVGALIIAGWDAAEGPQIYGCPIGGTLSKEKWTIDGSGSTYIWGYFDADYRDNFTREEAEAFITEGLALAMANDCSSGGCIRLVTVDKDGSHHKYIQGDQVPYRDLNPQPLVPAAAAAGMVIG
mmetsp:Transcript_5060/g.8801  ORF Transcript_5060/g.8801 Transcript_5060/m.8801 type:complete len:240 (+) Transcript_5060:137-856(+)|eukprot:CAMPEP_0119106890 /NCGR_PEP_ID=MMETSP1180-20130426/6999_1 /TAXON_ID=3052 ORGANISM="Chlamydomonas cf sp, Strain CCMP681" /NCGR_SAMPLE_ID=MMETSP1180 /ASSEMBLY_ACC=CAM_ASM_000741 /LENGTH=239 /DNA_ID=CAMNT_0007092293 /DNA_START=137 /DNA_END=856 /DNA_ORIENTATION=+